MSTCNKCHMQKIWDAFQKKIKEENEKRKNALNENQAPIVEEKEEPVVVEETPVEEAPVATPKKKKKAEAVEPEDIEK